MDVSQLEPSAMFCHMSLLFLEIRRSLFYFVTCKNRLISLPKTGASFNPQGGLVDV